MTKITLEDDELTIIMKMSEGNPGAMKVLSDIISRAKNIDPHAMMGGIAHILQLDTCEIYGSKIWMLYKDVCNEDIATMIAMIRALQLGITNKNAINYAISNHGEGIDTETMIKRVESELPKFDRKG